MKVIDNLKTIFVIIKEYREALKVINAMYFDNLKKFFKFVKSRQHNR